ncbi:MAG TPA: hypothetical protein ENK23_02140, partial [Sorangium sp.]|nr:hypothetical protein [Sorangium sp.]
WQRIGIVGRVIDKRTIACEIVIQVADQNGAPAAAAGATWCPGGRRSGGGAAIGPGAGATIINGAAATISAAAYREQHRCPGQLWPPWSSRRSRAIPSSHASTVAWAQPSLPRRGAFCHIHSTYRY